MRTDWKRSLAVLLGTGVIALTAACGAEVAGTAQGGIPAAANAVSTSQQETGGSSEEAATSGEAEPSATVAESSPEATSESAEPGGNSAEPETLSPSTVATSTRPVTTSAGGKSASAGTTTAAPTTKPSSAASSADYAFTKDYCTLMPKSFTTGLEKDTTRKPDQTCTYKAPDSSKVYRAATVTGGFALGDDDINQSYNVDATKVKIDGRDGWTWTNSSKTLYSATFNLPDADGGEMSILVIISDDKSPAELKKTALALAAAVSKEVPR